MEQTSRDNNVLKLTIAYMFLSAFFVLAAGWLPFIGGLALFVWALPVIVATVRCGVVSGIFSALTALVAAYFCLDTVTALICCGSMCILGLLYGICFKKKVPAGKILWAGILTGVALPCIYFVAAHFSGFPGYTEVTEVFRESLDATLSAYSKAGLFDAVSGMSSAAYAGELTKTMLSALPSVLGITAILISALNFIVPQALMKRFNLGVSIEGLPSFSQWHLPWGVLWIIALALIFFVGGNFFDQELYVIAAKNIMICIAPVLAVGGISMLRWLFIETKVSRGMQVFFWITVVLFSTISMVLLPVIGGADALSDYREKIRKKREEKKNGGHKI